MTIQKPSTSHHSREVHRLKTIGSTLQTKNEKYASVNRTEHKKT